MRSICAGSSPTKIALICRIMAATVRFAILVVVVISPQPVTPSSVVTSMKKYSPQYVPSALTSQGSIEVIFIGYAFQVGVVKSRNRKRRATIVCGPTHSLPRLTLHHKHACAVLGGGNQGQSLPNPSW